MHAYFSFSLIHVTIITTLDHGGLKFIILEYVLVLGASKRVGDLLNFPSRHWTDSLEMKSKKSDMTKRRIKEDPNPAGISR
ncbi:hypothetical protein M5K25_020027 [Dendrobium thyrsiflorum]|uniref:Uncharacterized protein n=1 Tax=Dendrobium thyrsiflorum TaxID=117978 RepID=A0ABD0U9G8_DENTH